MSLISRRVFLQGLGGLVAAGAQTITLSVTSGTFENDALTVWTHSQGVYPLRDGLAEMLSMPKEKVSWS